MVSLQLLHLTPIIYQAVLTGVSIVMDHLTILGFYSFFTHSLESKPNSAAGVEVRQDKSQALFYVPQMDLLCHMISSIEVEDTNEEKGILFVLRWSPDQGYGSAVPGHHFKVLWNIWI